MKSSRFSKISSTVRSIFLLAILLTIAWYLATDPDIEESLGPLARWLLWILLSILILIVGARWWQRQRAPKIYPFLNATGEKEKEKYDALAHNFTDLLQLEVQRINQLLYIPESITVHNPAYQPNVVPRPIAPRPAPNVPLGATAGEDELRETFKSVGTLSLGPISLPLGSLLGLAMQALQGGGISGSIQKYGSVLTVVATYGNRKWEVQSDSLPAEAQDDAYVVRKLARQLAYRMLSDISEYTATNWRSFEELIEGLEHYQRFLRSGHRNLRALQSAQQQFERTIIMDGQFALAYHNLGVTYDEQGMVDSALEMYKLAIQIEPKLREARFRLGVAYFNKDLLYNAIQAAEYAVDLAVKAKRPFPVARNALSKWLIYAAQDEMAAGNYQNAIKHCQTAIKQLRAANKEYKHLSKQSRRQSDYSSQRENSLRESQKLVLQELRQAYMLLANIAEGRAEQNVFWRLGVTRAHKRVERTLKNHLKLNPNSAEIHAELGGFYVSQKKYKLAAKHLERAKGISPEDVTVSLSIGQLYLDPAVEDVSNLITKIQEEPEGWQTEWGEDRLNATYTQLELAASYYQNVLDLKLKQGEAEAQDQDTTDMIQALNRLAAVDGAVAILKYLVSQDITYIQEINLAKILLGKALVLQPLEIDTYDSLVGIYLIDRGLLDFLENVEFQQDDEETGEVVPDETDFPDIDEPPSDIDYILTAYQTLLYLVSDFGYDPHWLIRIVVALAFSSKEERQHVNELRDALLNTVLSPEEEQEYVNELRDALLNMDKPDLPPLDQVEDSPVTQVYLWVAGWSFMSNDIAEIGIEFLERAQQMGDFLEAAGVTYDLGIVYRNSKRWEEAEQYFRAVEEDDLYSWQSQIALAETLQEAEKLQPPERAQAETEPDNEPGKQPEATVAETWSEDEKPLTAEQVYTNAIEVAADDPYRRAQVLAGRGALRYSQKRYALAIQDCQEAAGLIPGYPYPYLLLANVYMDLLDYDRVIENWKRVRELIVDQDIPDYHLNLGNAYRGKAFATTDSEQAGQWLKDAAHAYEQAIRLFKPDEATEQVSVYADLGQILTELKQYREAESVYRAALELEPESPEAYSLHTQLAEVLVKLNLFGDARLEYQQAIDLGQKHLEQAQKDEDQAMITRYASGLAYAYDALAYYVHAQRGVKLEEGLSLVNRALEALEWTDYDQAIKDMEKGNYLETRGLIYYKQENYDEAQANLEQAIELTMGDVDRHGQLALVYEKKAELSETEADQKRWKQLAQVQWKLALEIDSEGEWEKVLNSTKLS